MAGAVQFSGARCAHRTYLWHIDVMKALKSKLATELLSDPQAREHLRAYLVNKVSTSDQKVTLSFTVRSHTGLSRIEATVVPKAAKTA
jgi:hypothetical protein